MAGKGAAAVVVGGIDLMRALTLAGIRSTLVAERDEPARFSRFCDGWIDARSPDLVAALLDHARRARERPVLFYGNDRALRFVSDNRDALLSGYRTVLPERRLVDDLLDKARFQALAQRLDLPVPRARLIAAGQADGELGLRPPVVVKPASRDERWFALAGWTKVRRVDDEREWHELAPRLAQAGIDVLVQEHVEGGEDRIESHHAYVDGAGRVAAEFVGRKIRTRPPEFGVSTALVTTGERSVAALGREVLERVGLRGVAKVDFKRAPDGELRLLEINPRFTLWAHLGARAGVNLPALVHAELTGRSVQRPGPARAGVRWCDLRHDAAAARESGVPIGRWLPWALACEAKSGSALDDPMPVLRGKVWPRLTGRRAWL